MGLFQRSSKATDAEHGMTRETYEMKNPTKLVSSPNGRRVAPGDQVNQNGHKVTKHIHPDGESGRSWFHPWHFLRISFLSASRASMMVNLLWPVVPAAIAVYYTRPESTVLVFTLNYIAMVPAANLVGFAGQELARKMPRTLGVLTETTLGSIVEIVLFMVLLQHDEFPVIQAAVLGSILATLLLCLGLCFFVGGMRRDEQVFDEVIAEVGNGLLLTAGLALIVPAAFDNALTGRVAETELKVAVVQISRITSVLLIVAYAIYVWFQMHTHHGIYDAIFEQDEMKDVDRHKDLRKAKLTLTESIIALAISLALVTIIAINLVQQIEPIVRKHHVSDSFMGLILVPLVEKAAEHLTAIDEAWDDTMNLALSHVLGATIQTALFNAPLVVIVAWGLNKDMDLNFNLFDIIVVILAIIVVGNFLKDRKSNYLEGALCVIVYIIIAVAAFYYPNLHLAEAAGTAEAGTTTEHLVGRGY